MTPDTPENAAKVAEELGVEYEHARDWAMSEKERLAFIRTVAPALLRAFEAGKHYADMAFEEGPDCGKD